MTNGTKNEVAKTLSTTREDLTEWQLFLGEQTPGAPAAVVAALQNGLATAVPGSVLGSLIAAGLATDVTVDGREEDVAWASDCSWIYRTAVARQGDGARVTLRFEGIDTLATVRVDGEPVLMADDMFHAWSVSLDDDQGPGEWDIEVELNPVLPVAAAMEAKKPLPRADMYDIPFNQVRKMACSFGWDWGPTTVTAGLWRAATVTRVHQGAITRALLTGDWREGARLSGSAKVSGQADVVIATVRAAGEAGVLVSARIAVVAGVAEFDFAVPGASPWNVIHRGEQPLYDVELSLVDAADSPWDVVRRRVGFRAVELIQELDDTGRSFEFHVNGERVWARGFNWIPADVLPERVTRERTRALVQDAVDTGANMLRVWGGGVVESADFFDACDEAGVLVWQDFSFACAAYAEDEAQSARVTREVEDAIERAGSHPSLALWCGCNENLWGFEDWGWKETLGQHGAWGAHLYYDVIPTVIAALDVRRPYIPGSPFSPDAGVHPNDPTQGTTHHWDTWNQIDYTAFEQKTSRFASEFGWQAPAQWGTLSAAIGSEPTSGSDARVQRLQKHPEGAASLARGIADHVPHLPADGRGWYFATQLMQARAILASVGRFRSLHDTCSGALWWQLNDCWPALSWAVVDVTGARKLGWYTSAAIMAPRAIVATAPTSLIGVTIVNDVPQPWQATAHVRAVAESGEILCDEHSDIDIAADASHVLVPSHVPADAVAVVVDVDGIRAVRWLVPDRELRHPAARVTVESVVYHPPTGSTSIAVRATDLIRDLALLAETHPGLEAARVDRQLLTLLPGESATFAVTGQGVDALSDKDWAGLLVAGTALVVQ